MFLIRKRLIQHAHIVASVGLRVVLGVCVGQTASSKGSASQFLMVVITDLRMIAWGGGQAKEGHWKFSDKMVMRWSFTPPKGGTGVKHAGILQEQIMEHG